MEKNCNVYVSKDDLRQEFILPLLDKVEEYWNDVDEDYDEIEESFYDEVSSHPEYPTSKMFVWLNHLENTMCSSEPATEFEIQVCSLLPNMLDLFTDWDACYSLFKDK